MTNTIRLFASLIVSTTAATASDTTTTASPTTTTTPLPLFCTTPPETPGPAPADESWNYGSFYPSFDQGCDATSWDLVCRTGFIRCVHKGKVLYSTKLRCWKAREWYNYNPATTCTCAVINNSTIWVATKTCTTCSKQFPYSTCPEGYIADTSLWIYEQIPCNTYSCASPAVMFMSIPTSGSIQSYQWNATTRTARRAARITAPFFRLRLVLPAVSRIKSIRLLGSCIHSSAEVDSFYAGDGYFIESCFRSCQQDVIFAACGCMDASFPKPRNVLGCDYGTSVTLPPLVEGAKSGERPFIIYTDASKEAIGAVLCQEGDDGHLHPLYFASQRCSPAERNYHVTDSEALVIVFALRKFRPFYFGTRVVVRTDHQPLKAMFGEKSVSARILRWALEIQSSDVCIEYVVGAANRVADPLSRSPVAIDKSDSERVEIDRVVNSVRRGEKRKEDSEKGEKARIVRSVQLTGTREKWKTKTAEDTKGAEMLERVRESREQAIRDKGWRWTEEGGILCVQGARGGKRFFVPESLRMEILSQWHDGTFGGHWSAEKVTRKLMKDYYWERMKHDVEQYVKECQVCEQFNTKEKLVPSLKPILASEPFEIVAFDVLEIGTSVNGNRYILSIIDSFTKFGAAFPMETKSAREVAENFLSGWVAQGRMPRALLSDQGGEFVNKVMTELLSKMGIEQIVTKGYNPRENGLVERFNQTIIQLLQKKVREPERWDEMLPFVMFTYNSAPHSSTGESPFFLVYGRDPRPLGETLAKNENVGVDVDDYKVRMQEALKAVYQSARENAEKETEARKTEYDKKHRVEGRLYPKIGDKTICQNFFAVA